MDYLNHDKEAFHNSVFKFISFLMNKSVFHYLYHYSKKDQILINLFLNSMTN